VTGPASRERGFALPAVIFLVALLTLLLTSGLTRVQSDRQIAEAAEATADAFAIAQSGLQNYLGTRTARPPNGDSVRINVTGGYANVIAEVVRNPADTNLNELYLVRSTGIAINPLAGATPQARRTVAQFANWQPGWVRRRGALTTTRTPTSQGSDLGTPRVFSGVDECGVEPPIPGLRTVSGAPTVGVTYTGGPPGLLEQGPGQGPTIAVETGIDWLGALSPGFVPDYNSFQNGDNSFSIQRVMGNLSSAGAMSGTGLLIVEGDLQPLGPGFYFEGVILVGGAFYMDADTNVVHGMVFTGLSRLADPPLVPLPTRFGGDGEVSRVYFNSCKVNQAVAALKGMIGLGNAWLDFWATY
jgi:type II secretory pathway pseudopilin PulG